MLHSSGQVAKAQMHADDLLGRRCGESAGENRKRQKREREREREAGKHLDCAILQDVFMRWILRRVPTVVSQTCTSAGGHA